MTVLAAHPPDNHHAHTGTNPNMQPPLSLSNGVPYDTVFKQGAKPAVVVPLHDVERFRMALRRAGYYPHTGHRYQRDGERQAWTTPLRNGRHIHVQEVHRPSHVDIYAHTEPAHGLLHAFSALTDAANYAAGSRKLRSDLRAQGWCSNACRGPR